MRRALRRFATVAAVATVGCEAFLTEPAPPPATVEVSFQIEAPGLGGPAQAFSKVRRVSLRFVRPDSSFRDTVVAVQPVDGRIRVPLAIEVGERVDALGVGAMLGFATTNLFDGAAIVRIEPGQPTSAVVPIQAIPAAVRGDPPLALIPNVGESLQLSSAVLFASADTITGLEGAWLSEDAAIVSVTPNGLATAQRLGQTRLEVRFGTFTDTIVAATSPVDTVLAAPADTTLVRGETVQLDVTLQDGLGNTLVGRVVTFVSLDGAVATVDPSGLVTALGVGTTGIVISANGAVTTVSITVL